MKNSRSKSRRSTTKKAKSKRTKSRAKSYRRKRHLGGSGTTYGLSEVWSCFTDKELDIINNFIQTDATLELSEELKTHFTNEIQKIKDSIERNILCEKIQIHNNELVDFVDDFVEKFPQNEKHEKINALAKKIADALKSTTKSSGGNVSKSNLKGGQTDAIVAIIVIGLWIVIDPGSTFTNSYILLARSLDTVVERLTEKPKYSNGYNNEPIGWTNAFGKTHYE